MIKVKLIAILSIVALQIGCAVFPVTRTYFEPNIEDGKPTRSSSCGYNMTAEDSLERDIDDFHIKVSPFYEEGQPLSATILFRYSAGDMELQPEQFELHSMPDGGVYKPNDISRTIYGPDKTHPYYSIWVHLKYPVVSEKLEAIKFMFPATAIKRNGININLAPFRFKKVKKSDVYYGSINC